MRSWMQLFFVRRISLLSAGLFPVEIKVHALNSGKIRHGTVLLNLYEVSAIKPKIRGGFGGGGGRGGRCFGYSTTPLLAKKPLSDIHLAIKSD